MKASKAIIFLSTLLLTSVSLAQTIERGLHRVTICEMVGNVTNNDNLVEEFHLIKGGMGDRTKQNLLAVDRCHELVIRKATRLCKRNNRKNKVADSYEFLWGFKAAVPDNSVPDGPCMDGTEPTCFDFALSKFSLQTQDAGVLSGSCSDLVPELIADESAQVDVVETDLEENAN